MSARLIELETFYGKQIAELRAEVDAKRRELRQERHKLREFVRRHRLTEEQMDELHSLLLGHRLDDLEESMPTPL